MRDIQLIELSDIAKHYEKLCKEVGFFGLFDGNKIQLMEKQFKEVFVKWETEEFDDKQDRLVAEMYGTKFIALAKKEKNEQ